MPRDSSGNYTLPTGNPVVPGTVIESAWANSTASDIAIQLNNLVTRDGLLGPTAPILFPNGTVGLPSIAFALSPSTGFYRYTPNNIGLSIAGVQRQAWDATGSGITGNFGVTGTLGVTGDVTFAGNANIAGNVGITGNVSFAGHLLLMDGTLAAPAYTFTSDVSTGMYRPAAAQLGFSVTGIPILTATISALSSTVNSDSQAGFFATNNSAGTHSAALFKAINNSGKNIQIAAIGSANTDYPAASSTGVLYSDTSQGLMLIAQAASSYIRFASNGFAEQMRLNSIGLGIGVAASTTGIKLDVNGTIRGIGGAGASGSGVGIRLVDSTGFSGGSITVPEGSGMGLALSGDGGPMAFLAGGSQRMLITSAGLVGINRTPTSFQLEVGGGLAIVNGDFLVSTSGGGDLRLGYNAYTSNSCFNLWAQSNVPVTIGSGGAERMRVDYNGTVTIGRAATPPPGDGLLQLFNATRVPKIALVKTSVQGWYLGADSASTGAATQLFNIFANGGPLLTIDPGTGWIGLSSGAPGQSFFQLTQPGYDGNPKQFSAAGPYGNFMNFYGGSMSNGGGVVELNGHTSVSSLASWQMLHHSDIAANDLLFRYAPTQTSRAALVYTERFRVNVNGVATVTQGVSATVACDANNAANPPVGAIVFGQATLPGGSPALTGFGTFTCSGSNPIAWGGYTGGSAVSITTGVWRNIGASTAGGVGLWMRIG